MKRILLFLTAIFACVNAIYAQGTVSGVVTEGGEPLVGVNILLDGSNLGTITALDGSYSIAAKVGDTVIATYIGYEDQKVAVVREGQKINFEMAPSSVEMEAVVAIGYGYVKKSDLTGSVASVDADQLKKAPVASVDQALQGLAAGVSVNANSGQPGATAEVRVRGVGTINNANPLYVVDGVMVSDISYLNPGDVESTEVLKDASATAIYGSRGANGVILIKTKRGKAGEAVISFNSTWSVQNACNKLSLMNSSQFADALIGMNGTATEKILYEAAGLNAWLSTNRLAGSTYFPVNDDYYTNIDTDWQDEIFQENAFMQNYDLSITGGSETSNYAFSASYFDQEGTIIGSDFERMTIRANTSFQPKPWLKIGENMTYVKMGSNTATVNNDSPASSIISAAIAMAPWDPTHYAEGAVNSLGEDLSGQIAASSNFKNVVNPFTMVEEYYPMTDNERFIGDVYFEITPVKGLVMRSDYSLDYGLNRYRLFKDSYEYSSADYNEVNFLSSSMARSATFMMENTISYNRDFGKHGLSLLAGQTTEEYNYYYIGGSGSTILNASENNWYLNQTTDDKTDAGDSAARTRRTSYFGRVHYSFDSRYMITANFRADGSSLFTEGNNWGYFPSLAFAWRLSDEPWMPKFDNLGSVKVRAGWGQIGNDQVGSDSFNMTIFNEGPTFVDYVFGSTQALASGASVLTYVNNGGKWETTEQLDFGVDISAFNNKISATIDLYQRDTKDMLLYTTTPAHVGNYYYPLSNVGVVRNRGVEFTLGLHEKIGAVDLSINGNVSFVDNELVALNGGSAIYLDGIRIIDEGYSLYTFYGYEYDGIYQTDDEAQSHLPNSAATVSAGDARFVDQNGDGMIDDSDKVDIGNPYPWLTYGLNIEARYKQFDLQLFFQGVEGNEVYNALRIRTEGNGTSSNLSTAMSDVWSTENTSGSIPNPNGNSLNSAVSSRFVEDGSYLRLKNVQFGYQLPQDIAAKLGMQSARLYVSASNLFTLTGYSGYDPEVTDGVDYGNYPQSKVVSVGLNLNF